MRSKGETTEAVEPINLMAIKNKQNLQKLNCSQESCNADDNEQIHLYNFVNSMLKGRLFIGDFQEKRYVASLNEYRDVIVIEEDGKDLHVDLEVIKKRLSNAFKTRWIGITTPKTIGAPAGYCIWVDLHEEVFGKYWYKIRSVSFRGDEILLKIKPLKAITQQCSSGSNTSGGDSKFRNSAANDISLRSLKTLGEKVKSFMLVDVPTILCDVFTLNNIKEATKFLVLLTGAALVGMVGLTKFLADFSLRLLRELSNLIRSVTPFTIACVDMCGKVIGGFYLLIAVLWRDSRRPQTYQRFVHMPKNPMLTYKQYQPLGRRYGSTVKITELK